MFRVFLETRANSTPITFGKGMFGEAMVPTTKGVLSKDKDTVVSKTGLDSQNGLSLKDFSTNENQSKF